jgi:CubicO group peptidase (beta-lactamase class C family)
MAIACSFPAHAATLVEADLLRAVEVPLRNKSLQAVSLGVIQREGRVTAHAGTLAPDNPAAPDDRTIYEIGSITKVFTALLLADAVVRGEVTLDTPIAKLLPPDTVLPDGAGDRITLRMLATHTSGLPRTPVEIPTGDFRNPYARYSEADLWASLRKVKLDSPPGTKAEYSNLGAGLLGTLLARRAGKTYPELIESRIAAPLGMKDTVVTMPDALRPRFAPGFSSAGQAWSQWDFIALAGAGGIRSTMADMMRFAEATLRPEGTPLKAAIDLAYEKQELAATISPGGQALGWLVGGDKATHWHNGMTGGFHAAIYVNRGLGIASVVLTNRSTPAGTEIAEGLVRRAAGMPERVIPNRDRAEIAVATDLLDRYAGTFRLSPKMTLTFERRNQSLFVTPTGQATDRLFAAEPHVFFSRRVPADLVFEVPADGGPATAVTLKQGGREMRGLRE